MHNNGLDFEYEVQQFFEERGFPVFETAQSHDYGADLILYFNGTKIAIQCKDYSSPVGISAVQEVIGAVKHYEVDVGMVISKQVFTKPARQLAASNNVILIGGNLYKLLMEDVSGSADLLAKMLGSPHQYEPEQQTLLGKFKSFFTKGNKNHV